MFAIGPLIALIVGLISLFYDKSKSGVRWPLWVLLAALFATCAVELVNKRSEQQAADEDRRRSEEARKRSDETISNMALALANFESKTIGRFEQVLARLPEKLAEAKAEPIVTADVARQAEGYAYYGVRTANGTWSERYFDRVDGNATSLPEQGDTVTARSPVNARAGYIEFSAETGWTNKRVIGAIRPGDRLNVVEVNPILGSYIWIKFRRES